MEKLLIETSKERSEAYKAPKCEIIEIQNEGMICKSGNEAEHEGYENGDYSFGWNN